MKPIGHLSLFSVLHGVISASPVVQLTQGDIDKFPAVRFGDHKDLRLDRSPCRAFPGDDSWPSQDDWNSFNDTLGGVLLQPAPPGAACYAGSRYNAQTCRYLVRLAGFTHFWLDDPVSILTDWTEGSTCVPAMNTTGRNCTQGGFPVYVVNATTVKHVQAAVNFARNQNLRLVIKSTGHDFGGRSTGAGSLSVWPHYMKDFEFLANYSMGEYQGPAVRVGAGLEAWELFNYMTAYNISVVAAGGNTVSATGGWIAGGGHSTLVSYLGLGSDQVLSIDVVLADGTLVTADPSTNEDLFFALRGGGGGTYGVTIAVVMKAYPPLYTITSPLSLTLASPPASNSTSFPNSTTNATTGPPAIALPGTVYDPGLFWQGVNLYYRFGQKVVDAGGIGFTYIYHLGDTYSLFASSEFPNMTSEATFAFMQPLYDDLNRIGINVTNPAFLAPFPYATRRLGSGDSPINTRYRSRLFPRENWEDEGKYNRTMQAIRESIEAGAGFTFHGILQGPSYGVAGWPGSTSAVNPAWRNAVMHASLMETQAAGMTVQQAVDREAQAQHLIDLWREVTPGSGAYMNEGDPGEPNWQQSFFGDVYSQLLVIKQDRDPWNLFWAPTTVGSEGWEVLSEYPNSQNGRLCRVNASTVAS